MGGSRSHGSRSGGTVGVQGTTSGGGGSVPGPQRLVGGAGPGRAPGGGRSPRTRAQASTAAEDVAVAATAQPALRRSSR